MAKTDGYSLYVCDRDGAQAYLAGNDPHVSDWHTIERVTADGVKTSRLLCPDCHTAYKALAAAQDAAFNAFMAGKE